MKRTLHQAALQVIITLALFLTFGCAPTKDLSSCDNAPSQNENGVTMPDFGFSLNGTCNEVTFETDLSDASEPEDDLLKDIEEPEAGNPFLDMAATLGLRKSD
ncbi:MAG: hypothetical protein D3917_01095 [Candidatus Electrothrix sp. AX5]|jgi:hypothetical protein|uniref:Lipoprotein n=1 Tax=Candidatus Electrothrix aarhusensis TaxID=1859131 RepID=A0A3S3SJ24_9BACT|nr:hypothetical protein [Candidatus Electrothrix sp. AX5]RWX43872.1 hypothetical protein H206_02366 [Candidatus Electrothrix aarhusensis]